MSEPRSTKLTSFFLLLAIVALGAFLRLYNLGGASLWIDEITFVNESNPALGFVESWNVLFDRYPWYHRSPLPVMIEMVFTKLCRTLGLPLDEAAYRFPAVVMGLASILVLYRLGQMAFGRTVGLLAAFLVSTSFFHIYYSREVYMYAPYYLFALLSWQGLASILADVWNERSPARWKLMWYGINTALVLQMHMAAIFVVFAQFLALVATAWSEPLRSKSKQEKSARLFPVLCAHLAAWIPFLPFVWIILFRYQSTDQLAVQDTGFVPLMKMLGEMGWSSQPIPLALFLVCVAAGAWVSLRDPKRRNQAMLAILLAGVSAAGVLYFAKQARFETRYFLVSQPCLLLFVAAAWAWLGEKVTSRMSPAVGWVAWVVPCVALLAGHFPFYRELYQLNAKALAGREIANWIVQNTPVGSVYVMDNAYVRREVPEFYPTPGRYAASPVPHHSPEDRAGMAGFIERVFRRFSDCYFVDTQRDLFRDGKGQPTEWLRTTFRRHVRIENPAFVRLFHMGMYPSGAFNPSLADPSSATMAADIYYNTLEDLLAMHRVVVLFGREWDYAEVPLPQGGSDHWKALRREGRIFIHSAGETPEPMSVRLRCGSYFVAQSIVVELEGRQLEFALAQDKTEWLELGTMTVRPGKNEIIVRKKTPQSRTELANLMVNEAQVAPIAPK